MWSLWVGAAHPALSRGENFVFPHVRCARLSLYLDNTGCGSASARRENFVFPLAAALAFPCIWIIQDAARPRHGAKTSFSPLPLRSPFTIFVRSLSSFSSGDRGGCTPVGKGTNFAPLLLWPEKKTRKRIAWVAQLDRAAVS